MTRWQYLETTRIRSQAMTSDDLCGLGEKGWELVSVAATAGDAGSHTVLHYFFGSHNFFGSHTVLHYFFKREAPAPQEEKR